MLGELWYETVAKKNDQCQDKRESRQPVTKTVAGQVVPVSGELIQLIMEMKESLSR